MADLYLEHGTSTNVNPPLGYALLNHNIAVTEVNEDLVIQAQKQFGYYNRRFLNALNIGKIDQIVYNTIINNQAEARQVFELNTNINIEKQELLDLVTRYTVQNVDTGGTAAEIVQDIINEGYQIVKKI